MPALRGRKLRGTTAQQGSRKSYRAEMEPVQHLQEHIPPNPEALQHMQLAEALPDMTIPEQMHMEGEQSTMMEMEHTTDMDASVKSGKKKRGKKDGEGKKSKKKKKDGDREDNEGSLFEMVRAGKVALQSVVDDWIEAYKQDRDTALLNLIQFFIQCSGCRGKITPHMYANMEHAEIIRKMTEEFDEESGDYPLIMSGPQWKKFKTNFCEFVQVLVRQCQYSIIYDQYMMDNVISLLTGLTDSQVRAFRHTSTLASMKLMTALVDVALNLSINLDHTQRQYEAERQKNQSKRATERLEMLMAKRQEIEENQEEIRNMLTYIFKGVFVHRYRDTQSEIRAICMSEIGCWMKKYPNMFLDDSYLKYVGWTLYDRVGDVRLCCLKCLQPLYDTEELAPKLELFTNRFKDRIVEMTLDKEYDVAVAAVRLVISILKLYRYNEGVLSDKDCENVYELVYSSHRGVAQAAGEFLNVKLFSREIDEATKALKTKKGKKRSENTPYIRDLVQFFIESELHEHGAYLVDSLWDINDMMKDWECMTDLLLEEPGRGEEVMDDRQETSLIEIMVCCVKQAATGESPVGRGPNRKLTTKEGKQVIEDKTKLTEHFIITLSSLLAKYSVDAEKVANLLQIPQYFDLEIYTTSRQEKHLDALLRHVQEIVNKHTDSEVLENCSKVLECFCNEDYAIAGKCNVARSTLIDGQVEKYKEAYQDFFQEGEEPDEDEAYALMASLKRIYAFFSCHDLNHWNLYDSLFAIVKGGSENTGIPEEIVCKAMACVPLSIMWYQQALDENNPDKAAMKDLKKKLHEFMRVCHELMYHQQEHIQEEAYVTICDLLIVFSKQLANNPVMKPLMFEPDRHLQGQLAGFLNDKVFVEDDDEDMDENQKIEELHKRRNFLASFCKLVVYNVVMIRNAADMFKHYMKFYNDYGDIIKATLGKSREINKVATAKTLALSLTQLFKELQSEQGMMVDRTSDAFQGIKELARRFSLSFGLDQIKNREAVAAMHKEGILFSLASLESLDNPNGVPPNIAFLEILTEFTSKLMKQDKKTVLTYLDKHLNTTAPTARGEDWQPLLTYRNGLVQGEGDASSMNSGKTPGGRIRPPVKGAKRRIPMEGEEIGNQWYGREGPIDPTPARGVPHPQTSTAIKRRRVDDQESMSEQGTGTPQESEQGSEKEYEEMSLEITQPSQKSWLGSQQRKREKRQTEVRYGSRRSLRRQRSVVKYTVDEEEEDSIQEFESPEQFPSHKRIRLSSPVPKPLSRSKGRGHGRSRASARISASLFEEESPVIEEGSVGSEDLVEAW